MSQNDFVIANQSAPDFRADLNDALQALGSLNSGSTAPSTTYANMLWYDTSNNILKMRSEADDAWINIGTLNQSTNTFEVSGVLDEDDMASDSATAIPSQQSVKAYVDAAATRTLVAVETAAFTLSRGAWVKRQIEQAHNDISDASISSNVVTLPAGTYLIQADAVTDRSPNRNSAQIRIQNTTAGTTIAASAAMRIIDGDGDTGNNSLHTTGVVTLASSADIELQFYISGTGTANNRPTEDYSGVNPQGASLIVTKLA